MTATEPETRRGPAPVQGMGMLIGLLFLVLAALELMSGVTDGGGPHELFGVFSVSGLWALLHLLTGAVAVFCTRSSRLAARFLVAAGGVYAVVGLVLLLPLPQAITDALPMNTAGLCLVLGLGTAMLILGAGWLQRGPGRRR
ncbi:MULTISPECIES: DUF4383 domain-containing protein [unclassified Amycolatopsis]|uniref:DUF4383 domain-containing protein n=1 Tax=unclassified Amycolatopsis TaxID=2618356 RepID=UPI001FF552AF|nr:DUF4383 domain-containing protein [Amycolatopsis sp. FBCC-B4732]UOX91866.1 DUF4383 domain-containing protein [Amycolatopsis sp. FBCC-B4732]